MLKQLTCIAKIEVMKKRALIHVENTDNLIKFAKFLSDTGWEILSANKTEDILAKENIPVTREMGLIISPETNLNTSQLVQNILCTRRPEDYGNPLQEMYDQQGRKLEPNIHLVCLNVYPEANYSFNKRQVASLARPMNFHITSILRNAYINAQNLMILTDPEDYEEAMIQLKTESVKSEFRMYLAAKALNLISAYDGGISNSILLSLNKSYFSNYLTFPFRKQYMLEGGANPQQTSCLYAFTENTGAITGLQKLPGEKLGFNAINDISLAWEQVSCLGEMLKNQFSVKSKTCDGYEYSTQFTPQTGSVFSIAIKLNSVLGASLAASALESFQKTHKYDNANIKNVSIGFSSVVDDHTAEEIVKDKNIICIIAPGFTDEAKAIFEEKSSIRLIPASKTSVSRYDFMLMNGGLLFQTKDSILFDHWDVMTQTRPDQYLIDEMAFGILLSMASRSYSAVLLKNFSVVGISQAAKTCDKAVEYALSDARDYIDRNMNQTDNSELFADLLICDSETTLTPFVKRLIDHGLRAIIQPGTNKNTEEFVNYCNEHGVTMVFTGTTHISY
ncbi:MAG: hypothetical protein MJ162_04710 [Treponema sp.]|nr:hypothetical protein [Treponema sp.]